MIKSSEPSWWQCWPSKLLRYLPQHFFQAFDSARIWKSSFVSGRKEFSPGNNWVRLFHAFSSSAPSAGVQGLPFLRPPHLPSPPCGTWGTGGAWGCAWGRQLSCSPTAETPDVLSCPVFQAAACYSSAFLPLSRYEQFQKGHFWSKPIYPEQASK